jgi:hypothetical protein
MVQDSIDLTRWISGDGLTTIISNSIDEIPEISSLFMGEVRIEYRADSSNKKGEGRTIYRLITDNNQEFDYSFIPGSDEEEEFDSLMGEGAPKYLSTIGKQNQVKVEIPLFEDGSHGFPRKI